VDIIVFKLLIWFRNKSIADFGCSTGGILFHIENAKSYTGIDYDKYSIASARLIKKLISKQDMELSEKYSFFVRDFDKIKPEELEQILPNNIDISFLLSMGSWVKNWKQIYKYVAEKSHIVVLEINNVTEGEQQLDYFKELGLNVELIVDNSDDDVTNNNGRKTYIIS
jgi:SAM-dependent methyltransferase